MILKSQIQTKYLFGKKILWKQCISSHFSISFNHIFFTMFIKSTPSQISNQCVRFLNHVFFLLNMSYCLIMNSVHRYIYKIRQVYPPLRADQWHTFFILTCHFRMIGAKGHWILEYLHCLCLCYFKV